MVAAEITSTVAGVSRTVRPRREALSATALVLSGVCAAVVGTTGLGTADAVSGRRAAARREPCVSRPAGLACLRDCGADTSTGGSGSRACCAKAAGMSMATKDVRAAHASRKRRGRTIQREYTVLDLGVTSVARHREPRSHLPAHKPSDEAECLYSPTDIFACDHDCRQVSWLEGHYLASPSRDRDTQWH